MPPFQLAQTSGSLVQVTSVEDGKIEFDIALNANYTLKRCLSSLVRRSPKGKQDS